VINGFKAIKVERVSGDTYETVLDDVVIEEPLQISIKAPERDVIQIITMRTPGHDIELAAGFVYSEGIVTSYTDIQSLQQTDVNDVEMTLITDKGLRARDFSREFIRTSSCGVCGSQSTKALQMSGAIKHPAQELMTTLDIENALSQLDRVQLIFAKTGGSHAAVILDGEGNLISGFEDVGRHNAVDKSIGKILIQATKKAKILVVSSRAGFEIVQKAIIASIPVVCCVGAPTSLAVEAAEEYGVMLFGFTRNNRYNRYT